MTPPRFVDAPTPALRALARRHADAIRREVARALAHHYCNHELLVLVGAGGVVRAVPLAAAVAHDPRPAVGRRVGGLRASSTGDVACAVDDGRDTFVGHLGALGVSITQPVALAASHPALQRIEQAVAEVAAPACHDALGYAREHGLAPGDVACVVYLRPDRDSAGVAITPFEPATLAAEIVVGRRADVAANCAASHAPIAALLATPPDAARFWLVVCGFGLVLAREVPLLDDARAIGGVA